MRSEFEASIAVPGPEGVASWENPGWIDDHLDVRFEWPLGQGSFGSVFSATSKGGSSVLPSGAECAVKQIGLSKIKNLEKFQREIGISRRLDHPHIARLFEMFREAGKIYIVMEICEGGDLFERIAQEGASGFSEGRTAFYVRHMLGALGYLHSNGIAHRDVKPENFLLKNSSPDSALKLIDFGLANNFVPGVDMMSNVGSLFYVAPEVLSGGYDEKCDIWSAGVVTYILLCGFPPFSGPTDEEVLDKVRRGAFTFPERTWNDVSAEAKALVTQLLTVNPRLRPPASELLEDGWVQSTEERPRRAKPANAPASGRGGGKLAAAEPVPLHGVGKLLRVFDCWAGCWR